MKISRRSELRCDLEVVVDVLGVDVAEIGEPGERGDKTELKQRHGQHPESRRPSTIRVHRRVAHVQPSDTRTVVIERNITKNSVWRLCNLNSYSYSAP